MGLVKSALRAGVMRSGSLLVSRIEAPRRRRLGLSGAINRYDFIRTVPDRQVLEIGPFGRPALAGGGVQYFDVLDADALRARAADPSHHMDAAQVPALIHHVSPTGDLGVIGRTFDAVFSSHVVEHQPDLVAHLRSVSALLEDGGSYYLIVPDKRYCFDHFLPVSTMGNVLEAHAERRRVHTRQSVLDHWTGKAHNNPLQHWLGRHGSVRVGSEELSLAEAEARRADEGVYIDVHAWMFTPDGFRRIMLDLAERGMIGLKPVLVTDTGFGDIEFFAVLQKIPNGAGASRDAPTDTSPVEPFTQGSS